jgi:hypothetical protein
LSLNPKITRSTESTSIGDNFITIPNPYIQLVEQTLKERGVPKTVLALNSVDYAVPQGLVDS